MALIPIYSKTKKVWNLLAQRSIAGDWPRMGANSRWGCILEMYVEMNEPGPQGYGVAHATGTPFSFRQCNVHLLYQKKLAPQGQLYMTSFIMLCTWTVSAVCCFTWWNLLVNYNSFMEFPFWPFSSFKFTDLTSYVANFVKAAAAKLLVYGPYVCTSSCIS